MLEEWISMGTHTAECLWEVETGPTSTSVVAYYDPTKKTILSTDASSYGLGAVLLQEENGIKKPIAFASRSMASTEQRYAQIEKEALATTWAFEKLNDYILRK